MAHLVRVDRTKLHVRPLVVRGKLKQVSKYTQAQWCSSTSSSQNFTDGVNYALLKLGMSHIKLKDEQKQAILAAYGGKDVFIFLLTVLAKACIFSCSLSCLTISYSKSDC